MARKRKKGKSQLKTHVRLELIGLLFIALAIFGSGAVLLHDGLIPRGLEYIFRFFLGIWYFIGSLSLLITGIMLLVKRRYPNFLHKKMLGFYISFLGILLITHIQTFERLLLMQGDISIIKSTLQNFFAFAKGYGTGAQTGGGLIGGILLACCYYLFSAVGSKIIAMFSIIIGIIFITDLSVGKLSANIGEKIGKAIDGAKEKVKLMKERRAAAAELEINVAETAEPKPKTRRTRKKPDPAVENEEIIDNINANDNVVEIAYAKEREPNKSDTEVAPIEDESDTMAEIEIASTVEAENYEYKLPPLSLLEEPIPNAQKQEKSQIQATVRKLEQTFQSFGVKAKITKVHVGPAVTKYEVYPEAGVKVSKIVSLSDDLALALAAKDIRIEAPIPGKSAVGIEVPNQEVAMVSLRELLDPVTKPDAKLLFALGRDISGEVIVGELNKMPHMLIAGATGSGKSVCVNGIITSILMRAKPHEVKMMMIDPKKVELNVYNGIPHLLAPVVTDPRKASQALKKVVAEMERRYDLFSNTGARNIEGYNEVVNKHNNTSDSKQPHLPYIVVLVDELADLMMVAASDVEDAITRLAQMARAAGIHLIIATQRPSVDVITGIIKANIPSRIAFSVSSQIDSRTIIDSGGAEKLLGRGDMLFLPVGTSKPTRVQGAFLSDAEVERIVDHCIEQQKASYQEDMIPDETNAVMEEVDDVLFDDAVQLITELQSASVSMLQRRFRIGYTRAARLIDAMEDRGIVGPYEGSKPRTVLISKIAEEVDA